MTKCPCTREAVEEFGDLGCPLCDRDASAHRSEIPPKGACADCGAANPYLMDDGDGRMVCEHRYACEARQITAMGEAASPQGAALARGMMKLAEACDKAREEAERA